MEPRKQRERLDRRLQDLKEKRSPWEAQWRELAEFNAPHRLRFSAGENKGQKLRSKILDSSATFALRTLASGMHSGITSPARPWFKLATFDPDLKENASAKLYLANVQARMREVFQGSNIYPSFHAGYTDLGLFGQSAALIIPDDTTTIRMMPLLHGQFWLSRNERQIADTLYRELDWTVEKCVARFGYDACPLYVRQAYDKGDYDTQVIVNHAVEPRHEREAGKIDKKNKPYASLYWCDYSDVETHGILSEDGFDANPIIAPGWEHVADDAYCVAPGHDALPDVKQLQTLQRQSGEAIEKKVRPPMKAPTSMMNNPASLMTGSVPYVDDPNGRGYTAAIEVNISIQEVEEKIRQTTNRIDRAYYADLFLMLANMEGIQPRNTMELAERKEEKLLALGPVLENIQDSQLAIAIDRTFEAMAKNGQLPEPPRELEGAGLKVEYVSILAQAQKAIATGAIERVVSFTGNLAAVNPTVLDKINLDQAIDEYADALGAPASIVVSDEDVAKVRKERADKQAKQEQAAQMAAMMPAVKDGADAARLLAETDMGNRMGIQ